MVVTKGQSRNLIIIKRSIYGVVQNHGNEKNKKDKRYNIKNSTHTHTQMG